jgi:hypothetical protein
MKGYPVKVRAIAVALAFAATVGAIAGLKQGQIARVDDQGRTYYPQTFQSSCGTGQKELNCNGHKYCVEIAGGAFCCGNSWCGMGQHCENCNGSMRCLSFGMSCH